MKFSMDNVIDMDRYGYFFGMVRRPEFVRGFAVAYGNDHDDGLSSTIHVRGCAAVPSCGVSLRFNAVVDCSLGGERMPPVTIAFVKQGGGGEPEFAGKFTYESGDFVLVSKRTEVEEMVAAAGFPAEGASVVEDFCRRAAALAAHSFWTGVVITVEMAPPGTHIDDGDNDDDREDEDDEEAGAIKEDCAICYRPYVLGSAKAVQLSCSHAYHRTCLDKWVSVKRTCPSCRSPVPEDLQLYNYDGDYY